MHNDIPLSLYVHIPWCVKKCPYCDFNSHEKNHAFDEARYVQALLLDLEQEYQHCQQRPVHSIFFGGGTPSLFSPDSIHQLIEQAGKYIHSDDPEITLEANPGTFEQEKFNAYRQAGVNRLSIGVQSFEPQLLNALGRIHDDEQARRAVDTAQQAGFNNINLDLMFGLPGQDVAQARTDIDTAIAAGATHISHYQLTIEANTWFHKHTPELPDAELIWQMQNECQDALAENGYRQYEISAYAKVNETANRQCRHNLNYWHFGDYIGIGAGAHGKLSRVGTDSEADQTMHIQRRWKHRQPQRYIEQTLAGDALSGTQMIAPSDRVFEFLLNALRLKDGSDRRRFEAHTGLLFADLQAAVRHLDPALLRIEKDTISTTEKGFLFLNDVLEELL